MKLGVDNFISYHRNSRYSVKRWRRDGICNTSCLFHVAMFYYSTDRTPGSVLMLQPSYEICHIEYIRLENIQRVYIVHCTAHFTVLCTVIFLRCHKMYKINIIFHSVEFLFHLNIFLPMIKTRLLTVALLRLDIPTGSFAVKVIQRRFGP